MMIKRTNSAERRFEARRNPAGVALTGTEAGAIRQILSGLPSTLRMRIRLTSKGLATNPIASKCQITRLGKLSYEAWAALRDSGSHPKDEKAEGS